jgi:site-specific DNA-methyltransferase (adenine-specific)
MAKQFDVTIGGASLVKGDCLELMAAIPDGSVDMILCDLPYGTTACKWDVVIPFEPLWEQYKRIIKDKGAIVLFGSEPFSSLLRTSNLSMYKYDWIWDKVRPSNFFACKFVPLNKIEKISVFSFGGCNTGAKNKMNYFPQGMRVVNKPVKNSKTSGGAMGDAHKISIKRGEVFIQEGENYPKNVITQIRDVSSLHPTQKPVALLEYLIKTYTLEGETVLDNTMGSGTTGVACMNTGRKFLGIERDDKYFDIACERIQKANDENSRA